MPATHGPAPRLAVGAGPTPDYALQRALAAVAHLGHGAAGPWENRSHMIPGFRAAGMSYPAVAAWVNATYSVQLLQHSTHPGIDHLLVRRHDEGTDIGWRDLQTIKDRLLPDGQLRWAVEAYPPKLAVVDNANLRHVWVLPAGQAAPVDLREVRT